MGVRRFNLSPVRFNTQHFFAMRTQTAMSRVRSVPPTDFISCFIQTAVAGNSGPPLLKETTTEPVGHWFHRENVRPSKKPIQIARMI